MLNNTDSFSERQKWEVTEVAHIWANLQRPIRRFVSIGQTNRFAVYSIAKLFPLLGQVFSLNEFRGINCANFEVN